MTDYKAILCIDIDGTLINSNEKIHPNDIQILNNFPEVIQPILTTGRSLFSARGVLNENGLFTACPIPIPGIFMNGGAAYLPNERLCIQHTFSPKIRSELIALAQDTPQTTFVFFSLDAGYVVNPNKFSRHISKRHYLNPYMTAIEEIPEGIIKVLVMEENHQVLEHIVKITAGLEAEMAYSLDYLYEINPLGITKANSLTKLIEKLGFTGIPIFAVGDAENDLSLFQLSKTSFAPASAHPSILEHADHIINREENGLLSPILNYLIADGV